MNDVHLQLLNRGPEDAYVFLVPGVGGRCEEFRNLAKSFGQECTAYGLQMMGSYRAETPLHNIEAIAEKNIGWIREVQPEGPYHLVGHSFGVHVVYEMVRQLEREGLDVSFAALLDECANLKTMFREGDNEVDFVMQLTSDYYRSFHIITEPNPEWGLELRSALSGMPMKKMVAHIDAFMKQRIARKTRLIDLVSRLINLRIYNALMSYFPKGAIMADLILFKAAAEVWDDIDHCLGWSQHAGNTIVVEVPGNHISMLMHENSHYIGEFLLKRIKH
jgi:thioesterase domain-containing protein